MSRIEAGDTVELHYTSRTLEGGVLEASRPRDPLSFVAGGDDVVPGLSEAVIGMAVGEMKTVTLRPDEAFGRRRDSWNCTAPKEALPHGAVPGAQLAVRLDGEPLDVWVARVSEEEITLDANHPLADETLVIEFEIVGHDKSATPVL
ncbi:FKBP-type peptidyl-prolyl cis-trans isomerase SlyD [Maioricimonas rarisocia]|uniref:Peptidyl-prolyl cis-trans isomerase n=1 Tax=Maioricimonas rarisocia TaxID=2528026 RepID=A0A517Z2U4_9PLAN|nr:FKBP-type peptidyl-prolyl cis-trans isomerase [Maioricimonas rarisocia]QDU36795.1 FKBP-type peptidyl-prolyl cis-trans isomerase SlyD [Maioricimonas rarisocia]